MSVWDEHRRASTLRIVARDVGALQILIGAAMVLPLFVSLLYRETYSAFAFLLAAGTTITAGAVAYRAFRDAGEPERHHAMIIAGAGWLVSAIFGSLPFLFAAWFTPDHVAQQFVPAGATYVSSLLYFQNPLHAFFESMSGFTTTGMTLAVHEPSIGRGLLFYRSLAQWIGGVGVIVLSLAIIPRPRAVGGIELYQSETAGMKLRPNILGTARAIWKIYGILTALMIAYLFIATLVILPDYGLEPTIFDSVNHAMTGIATGGFSPLDDSIAEYGSAAMEVVYLVPMFLGMIAFPLYYAFYRQRDVRVFWHDAQVRLMLLVVAVVASGLVLLLFDPAAITDTLRHGVFQAVSALSSTGWVTTDISGWRDPALMLLAGGTMMVGGAAGSTAGGFKLIRAYVLLRAIVWRVRKVFLPAAAVVPFRIGTRRLPSQAMQREVSDAAVFTFLYFLVLGVCLILVSYFAPSEFTLSDAIFESVSAQGTIGLSTGMAHPGMPVSIELILIFQMWVGRLEIFPVLVLTRAVISWIARR